MNNSFVSAGAIPVKLFSQHRAGSRIRPLHLQFSPTNRCNLNCSFCSCGNREKNLELGLTEIRKIAFLYASLGTRAVTITGGGEPLMHPDIEEIIRIFNLLQIKIGLVTNGLLLPKIAEMIPKISWIRISVAGDRDFDKLRASLDEVMKYKVDFAFSYVCDDLKGVRWVQNYANTHRFTHVRYVPDLMGKDLEKPVRGAEVILKGHKIDDSRAIYQRRDNFTSGRAQCLISLLKPMISADGRIYPCCGVQYVRDDKDFPKDMSMGKWDEAMRIFKTQAAFNGAACKKCYYDNYNVILSMMKNRPMHEEFV